MFKPIDVEESENKLSLGVKCHYNPELVGSPRNVIDRRIERYIRYKIQQIAHLLHQIVHLL